ncbi:4'-phosphopantetheinyl transferase family protein [Denitromonas sp.]|uniref:4'-phosphopantetheinyl transferase family protein n=1 Tax=Denitromonas sp. TaxID=2734609 RepID=UPI002B001BED|nr:4'-phosphopantetheinyl transferase superfamily protein [Denitromonas sp.]
MTAALAIYLGTIDALPHQPDILTTDEHHRQQAMGGERRRRQFGAGRRLLRYALSHLRPQTPPEAWRFSLHDGRPTLDAASGLEFSLSHSGEHVGCIIHTGGRCGLDLQVHRRHTAALAAAGFDAPSNHWLARQPDGDLAFHQLWVLKEAWAKATATPLLAALRQTRWTIRDTPPPTADWSAGTTLRSGSLSVGWVAASAQPAPALWLWQRDGFVAQDVDWIPWALDALTDTPHRHDT